MPPERPSWHSRSTCADCPPPAGCRGYPPRPARGCTAARSHQQRPTLQYVVGARRWASRACRRACRVPPWRRARWAQGRHFRHPYGCWWPSSSGCVLIAATATLLASVISTALRVWSKVCSTGHRCRREGQLQRVETRLRLRGPREPRRRAAECRQRRRELGVALHESAVVVCQACQAPHRGARASPTRSREGARLLASGSRSDRRGRGQATPEAEADSQRLVHDASAARRSPAGRRAPRSTRTGPAATESSSSTGPHFAPAAGDDCWQSRVYLLQYILTCFNTHSILYLLQFNTSFNTYYCCT